MTSAGIHQLLARMNQQLADSHIKAKRVHEFLTSDAAKLPADCRVSPLELGHYNFRIKLPGPDAIEISVACPPDVKLTSDFWAEFALFKNDVLIRSRAVGYPDMINRFCLAENILAEVRRLAILARNGQITVSADSDADDTN